MKKRQAFNFLFLCLILIGLSACGSSTIEGKTGVLELTIQGLVGIDASVSVTGPNSFNQTVKANVKLENLATGDYTITASDVVQGDTYFPDKRQHSLVVKADETVSITLIYSKQTAEAGSLEITLSGLPAGTNADVAVTGPDNFSQQVTTSSVLGNLKPGDYQLTATTVTVGSDSYTPTPTSQTVGVAAGSKAELSVTYAKQLPTVGQLAITITGLPTNLNAAITVTGPNGFSETVTASKTFNDLQAGNYEVTASRVDGTYPYNPYPKTQSNKVSAGETASATLGYVPTIPLPHDSADSFFGASVAVDNDLMVVGAPLETSGNVQHSGFAYVYQRSASGEWQFVKQLAPPMITEDDHFGSSVAISGDTVVVGSPNAISGEICDLQQHCSAIRGGLAYVFKRDEGGANNFGYAYTLQTLGALTPTRDGDYFGASVAVSDNGNVIAIGVPGLAYDVDGNGTLACDMSTTFDECLVGGAYIFFSDSNISGIGLLLADDKSSHDGFGAAVAISGDTVVVGAYRDTFDADGNGTEECGPATDDSECDMGSAYLFERNQGGSNAWGQVKKLVSSDGAGSDHFGWAVAILQDTVVVGAPTKGDSVGAAYVFGRNEGGTNAWGQVKKLVPSDGAGLDDFGFSVALSQDAVLVSAPSTSVDLNQNGTLECPSECGLGAAYLFRHNQGGSNEFGEVKKLSASDSAGDDSFGFDVAMSANTVVIGSPGHVTRGAVYVFAP
jgi:FG-GAP repeat